MDRDPVTKTDRLTSGVLEFQNGTATFTCSTQISPYQRVNIFGTEGRIEIEVPFNPSPDQACKIRHQRGQDIAELTVDAVDQYTLQADLFALAVLEDRPVPTPLEDALAEHEGHRRRGPERDAGPGFKVCFQKRSAAVPGRSNGLMTGGCQISHGWRIGDIAAPEDGRTPGYSLPEPNGNSYQPVFRMFCEWSSTKGLCCAARRTFLKAMSLA